MPQLIWSERALLDVERIYIFLVEKNELAAQRAIQTIQSGIKILTQHPEIGRPAKERDEYYREWLIEFGGNGYIVLYRYTNNQIILLAIRHQKEAGY